MTMRKILSTFIAAVLLCTQTAQALDLAGSSAIVTDYATGYVIYEKNADTPCVPASMTKVMALYVFLSGMDAHGLDFDSPVTISKNVAALSTDRGLSNVRLAEGAEYSVDSLISAVCTVSACAATVALAEAMAGSEEAFVAQMNECAERLGLAAHYVDCYGISPQNSITPRSMAALAKIIIDDFPVILSYSSRPSLVWEGRSLKATNLLLPGLSYEYDGADGLKTGLTDEAGYCLTSTAVRDGRRIIASLFNAPDEDGRFERSAALLDYGFEHYKERIAEFYGISCYFDAPDSVSPTEDFTVCATLGNIAVPMAQRGEWLVNGIPIAGFQYDSVWIDNGSKIYFNYNANGFDGDSLTVSLRLFTKSDSICFDKVISLSRE